MALYSSILVILFCITILGYFDLRALIFSNILACFLLPEIDFLQPRLFVGTLSMFVLFSSIYGTQFISSILNRSKVIFAFFSLVFLYMFLINLININSISIAHLIGSCITLISGFLLVLILLFIYRVRGLQFLFNNICYAFIIIIFCSLFSFLFYHDLYHLDYPNNSRFILIGILDANYSALYILLIFITLYYTYKTTKKTAFKWIAFLVLFLLILTLSRTAWLISSFLIMLWLIRLFFSLEFFSFSFQLNIIKLFFGFSIFICLIYFFVPLDEYLSRIITTNIDRLLNNTNTASYRINMWSSMIANFDILTFLFGNGEIDIAEYNYKQSGFNMTFHNFYLTILFKYGILFVLAFMSLPVFLFNYFIINRAISLSYYAVIILITYLLFVMTISDEIGFFLFYILMLYEIVRNEKMQTQNMVK